MLSGFQNHACRTQNRLRRQVGGYLTGQARRYAAIAHGLDHHVDKSRTASAQARHRVDLLFGHLVCYAARREKAVNDFLIFGCRIVPQAISAGSATDQGRGIGHDAHDPDTFAKIALNGGQAHAGGNGNQKHRFAHRLLNG